MSERMRQRIAFALKPFLPMVAGSVETALAKGEVGIVNDLFPRIP
jgi:hypothetical protein